MSGLRQILFWLYLAGVFVIPFDLPASIATHAFFARYVGDFYVLFLPVTATALLGACVLVCAPKNAWAEHRMTLINYSSVALAFSCVGLAGVLASIANNVDVSLSVRQLLLGFIAPTLIVAPLLILPTEKRVLLLRAFYLGWATYLLVSLPLLHAAWNATLEAEPTFADAHLGVQLYLWRSTQALGVDNLYHLFLGNPNKASNYLVMFLLFSTYLLNAKPGEIGVRIIINSFWVLAVFTLIVLFSRAALILLPFIFWASGMLQLLSRTTIAFLLTAFIAIGIVAVEESTAVLQRVFLGGQQHLGIEAAPLGTFEDRFEQWDHLLAFVEQTPLVLLHGIGTGEYGRIFFGTVDRGTHNMFLDTLVESGATGFLSLVVALGLTCGLAYSASGLARRVSLVGVAVLILLMFREHSAAYLYGTSMGGLCFTMLFIIAARRERQRNVGQPGHRSDKQLGTSPLGAM